MSRMEYRALELPANLEHRAIVMADSMRVDEETGAFSGLALPWNTVDSYGTRFAEGAFAAGGLDEGVYALLVLHDPSRVAGAFRAKETPAGLWIEGNYDDTAEGRDARVRAISGSAPELSVGFSRTAVAPEDTDLITGARLYEVSQITARHASVPGAGLTSVRAGVATTPDEEGRQAEALVLEQAGAVRARLRLATLDR